MAISASDIKSAEERLKNYWTCLRDQKDRKTVREILEREVLLVFIQANKDKINEYPLLVPQQQAVIDFITNRAHGNPLHENTAKIISNFIKTLNKYGTLLSAGNVDAAQGEIPDLINHESLLLKAVQGVVYTTALTVDNFTEILIRYFGEDALNTIDGIMEEVELSQAFWKDHFDHFVGTQVDEAYNEIVERDHIQLNRENGQLVIRYAFDDVLSKLKRTDKAIEKTRAQEMHSQCGIDFESRNSRKMLLDFLRAQSQKPDYPFHPNDLELISQIACMDTVGKQFGKAVSVLRSANGQSSGTPEMSLENAKFICDQALAIACTSGVSLNILRQDFLSSLSMFESKELAAIKALLGTFDLEAIRKAFFSMLEFQFLAILRQKAGDDIGKMQLRTMRERRTLEADVDALFDKGMNRIRKNKIWVKDPSNEEYLIFRATGPRELKALVDLLQLEPPLIREIIMLWEKSTFKVSIGVHLNLDLISRTTTNLNQRLSEILGRFGVSA